MHTHRSSSYDEQPDFPKILLKGQAEEVFISVSAGIKAKNKCNSKPLQSRQQFETAACTESLAFGHCFQLLGYSHVASASNSNCTCTGVAITAVCKCCSCQQPAVCKPLRCCALLHSVLIAQCNHATPPGTDIHMVLCMQSTPRHARLDQSHMQELSVQDVDITQVSKAKWLSRFCFLLSVDADAPCIVKANPGQTKQLSTNLPAAVLKWCL